MNKVDDLLDLWEKVRTGDIQAYTQLHQKLYGSLYAYAIKILKDEDVVDDLLQDLFVNFWEGREKLVIHNVKAYFLRATRSRAMNHFRALKSKSSKMEDFIEVEIDFSREDIIIADESDRKLKQLLVNALNKLPNKQREIVYMRFYENLEIKQISEITGIKYQSVVNHVHRAIQSLRELRLLSDVYAA